MPEPFEHLIKQAQSCTLCASELKHGVRPVFQFHPSAKILIAGQAPGSKVHATGIPFNDPSGVRLRDWMGLDTDVFYDEKRIAILPMGFCYPGKGKSGDLPPLSICADTWRDKFMAMSPHLELILVIGQYAQQWHLQHPEKNLTATVRNWASYGGRLMPLPHPSPRNNLWLKKNPWFVDEVLPSLKHRVTQALTPIS